MCKLHFAELFSKIPEKKEFTYFRISKRELMKNEEIHIGIQLPDSMSEIVLNKIKGDFDSNGLKIEYKEQPTNRIMMGVDWLLPTAVVVYIFKSYFDGFLNEAGKEHYIQLKNKVNRLFKDTKSFRLINVFASRSTEKEIKPAQNLSRTVSLVIETMNGGRIKLLFDEDLDFDAWEDAISQLFDLTIENHNFFPNDKLTKLLNKAGASYIGEYIAIIDKNTCKLKIYGDKAMVMEYLRKKENDDSFDK